MAVFFTNAIDITPVSCGAIKDDTAVTVTPQGTPGITSYVYMIIGKKNGGSTKGQGSGSTNIGGTSTGNAVLSPVNFNRITWISTGADTYDVYRYDGFDHYHLVGADVAGLLFDDIGIADGAHYAQIINTTGIWQTVDVGLSGVPDTASGVMLHINAPNDHGTFAVRKKGSTDDLRHDHHSPSSHIIGINSDQELEVYFDEDGTQDDVSSFEIYLLGYFQAGEAVFFDNSIDISSTTGTWEDQDVSGDCPSGTKAIVAIAVAADPLINDSVESGMRCKGSSQTTYTTRYWPQTLVSSCDASRVVQTRNDVTWSRVRMVGYFLLGTFTVNRTSLGACGGPVFTFTDFTVSNPGSSTVLLLSPTGDQAFTRKEGSTDTPATMGYLYSFPLQGVALTPSTSAIFETCRTGVTSLLGIGYLYTHVVIDEPIIDIGGTMAFQDPEADIDLSISAEMLISPFSAEPITIATWMDHAAYQQSVLAILSDLFIEQFGEIDIPALQVSGSAIVDLTRGIIDMPVPTVVGTGLIGVLGESSGLIVFPSLDVDGVIHYYVGTGDIQIPVFEVLSRGGSVGLVGQGDIKVPLPFPAISALGHIDSVVTGATTLPAFIIHGFGFLTMPHEIYKAIVMNAFNYAVTEYYHFKFNSFAKFKGTVVATGPQGLYTLDSKKDDGEPIYAEFRSGLYDFRSQFFKYIREVWLTLKTDGQLELLVQVGEEIIWNNDLEVFTKVLHEVRGKIARGLRDRYFGCGLRNVNGSDFDVTSIRVKVEIVRGRTR
jgi:hypothetical protein